MKVELVKQSMTVNELAKQLDVSRDRLSLVINGKMMNEAIVSGVNNLLGINLVAVPSAVISIRLSRIFFNESSLKFCKSLNAIPSKLFSSVASGRNPCTGQLEKMAEVISEMKIAGEKYLNGK